MNKIIDISGQRFGRLVVEKFSGKNKHSASLWLCRCDCGNKKIVSRKHLMNGHSRSCGCIRAEFLLSMNFAHGENYRGKRSPEYGALAGMMARCYNQDHPSYPNYGGRGIVVCELWRKNHKEFFSYVDRVLGRRPSPQHSIDRINNDGNYAPGNIRWATRKEQAINRRSNRRLTIGGKTLTMMEWSKVSGIKYGTVFDRFKSGWSAKEAVFSGSV